MAASVHGRTPPPALDEPHPLGRLLALAVLALIAASVVGAFTGILVFVVGLAALAVNAAAHPHAMPLQQRPSARAASSVAPPRAADRAESRR